MIIIKQKNNNFLNIQNQMKNVKFISVKQLITKKKITENISFETNSVNLTATLLRGKTVYKIIEAKLRKMFT